MKNKSDQIVQEICLNALIAALYVAITVAATPISYNAIQFRISEILVLFCFFNKRYSIGLSLGCLIANAFSPMATLDILFGTAATVLACLGMMFSKHLAIAIIFPVIFNATLVAAELYIIGQPYWFSFLTVGAGELGVMIVGYILFILLRRNKEFFKRINATQNVDFKF